MTPDDSYLAPEAKARRRIDEMLKAAGWVVQDYREIALGAAPGVAVREFIMATGHGRADRGDGDGTRRTLGSHWSCRVP